MEQFTTACDWLC